jgi:uncharacterized protein
VLKELKNVSFAWLNAKISVGALAALVLLTGAAKAADPSPAAVEIASRLLGEIGLKASMDTVVPGLFGEFERRMIASRPELKDPLHATLIALAPEFVKSESTVFDDVAHVLASQMTEQELKDTETFFVSPSGKKYIAAQGPMLEELGVSARNWREKMSAVLLTRAREEMKKKGFDF